MPPLLHLYVAVGACIVCILLLRLAIRIFPTIGLLDFPERYGLKRARIPYPTGIMAVITFIIFFLLLTQLDMKATGLLIAITLLGVTSFADDRWQLPPALRLLIQVIICLIIFATGSRIYTITNPLEPLGIAPLIKLDTFDIQSPLGPLPLWSGVFTVLWLGLTMNAVNWFDGIPGQVSVMSVIGFLMLGFLALSSRVDQPELALLAFVLAGVAAGCLFYDFPPARMLMGDTGAMFFGLMLGVLSIYQGGKVATAFLALGIPLFDALFVSVRRVMRGSSPLKGNRDHLHHRLLAKGWSDRQVILFTALIGAFFGITALFLNTTQKGLAVIALFLVMMLLTGYSGRKR